MIDDLNDFHLLRIKNAMRIIEESLRELLNQSTYVKPQKRTRLKETNEFYNIKELPRIVGLGRSTIYLKIKDKTFPQPINLSERRVVWRKVDIHKWLDKKK